MGTRGTVNHMPGMDKSGNIHWIYWWAFATFIPVGITFFLELVFWCARRISAIFIN